MKKKKWFRKAVLKKPPYALGGWKKTQSATTRRRKALASRKPRKNERLRYLSAGRALQALANIHQDPETKRKAKADAEYFFSKLK